MTVWTQDSAAPASPETWWRGMGSCFAPLVPSDGAVRLAPCRRDELRLGDLVMLTGAHGALWGGVVTGLSPLLLSSLDGRARDVDATRFCGRVVALERDGRVLPLPRQLGLLWFCSSLLGQRARRSEALRRLVSSARHALVSQKTAWVRRAMAAPISLRQIERGDGEQVAAFAAAHLTVSGVILRQRIEEDWNPRGGAIGAFDGRGRLCGFGFVDGYSDLGLVLDGLWIRSVYVSTLLRGLGVAQCLIVELCQLAEGQGATIVRAAVEHDNAPSLAAFFHQGFRLAPPPFAAHANRLWRAAGSGRLWTILERPLPFKGEA